MMATMSTLPMDGTLAQHQFHFPQSIPQAGNPRRSSSNESSTPPYDMTMSKFVPSSASMASTSTSTTATSTSKKAKKLLVDRLAHCNKCKKSVCKLLLRGTGEELSQEFDLYYECLGCLSQSMKGTSSTAKPAKKRTRQTEDLSVPTVCDVCIKTVGRGGLVPKTRGLPLGFAVEVCR